MRLSILSYMLLEGLSGSTSIGPLQEPRNLSTNKAKLDHEARNPYEMLALRLNCERVNPERQTHIE
jgi:hypothetical protein